MQDTWHNLVFRNVFMFGFLTKSPKTYIPYLTYFPIILNHIAQNKIIEEQAKANNFKVLLALY